MKIYRVLGSNANSRCYSLSIDPGLSTAGVTVLSLKTGRFKLFGVSSSYKVLKSPYPELYLLANEMIKGILQRVRVPLKNTEVIIETSFYSGQFSTGLAIVLSTFSTYLLEVCGVESVVFVPPRVGAYFLATRSPSKSELVALAKKTFSCLEGRYSSHIIDSLLLSTYCHYDLFKSVHGIDLRVPNFEEVVYDNEFRAAIVEGFGFSTERKY